MSDFLEKIKPYYSIDIQEKKNWYSPAAQAYNRVRPRYQPQIINRVIELTQLSSDARILEIGCGPGNATVAFAKLGYSILCVEPNSDFCQIAQQNCINYPNVTFNNTCFEDWQSEESVFDAVLAATSIHWIPPEIAYPKAAEVLKENGYLILLWNVIPIHSSYELYQLSYEIYQKYAPSLAFYETQETYEQNLIESGKIVINSGKFTDLISEQYLCKVLYNTDDYLTLLSTLSPYLKLESDKRESLFKALAEIIESNFNGQIEMSYISEIQIAKKTLTLKEG